MNSGRGRRVSYLSGTRADFGLMQSTLELVAAHPDLQLQIIVTGAHLSALHGMTVDEVRASGLPIGAEIPMDMQTRTGASMALGLAACLEGVTRVLDRERPDLLMLLGDRGEMLAGAIAALHLSIPCVHLHGGERSGTVDEPVRHAISKLSTYHFVATSGSRERLLRMGEQPSRVHVTGAPGLDGLAAMGRAPMDDSLANLGLPADGKFIVAMFHPLVQQAHEARAQTLAILHALSEIGLPVLWMEPNADAGAPGILEALDQVRLPAGSRRLAHLPRHDFVRALCHAAVLVGNSSAGIIEAATFGTPVVNVGGRQNLRERSANVIDVPAEQGAIASALRQGLERGHLPCDNVYGDGHAGERIVALLAALELGPAVTEKTNTY